MSSPHITLAKTLTALDAVGEEGEPVTASELATKLGCDRETAADRLGKLAERGDIETKTVGGDVRVWWRSSEASPATLGDAGVSADADSDADYEDAFDDLLTQILDASPIGIGVLTADGTITHVNARARTLLGFTHDEVTDTYAVASERRLYDADGTRLPPSERPFARAVETGEPIYNEELQMETADGDRLWVSMNVEPLFGDDGTVKRLVVAGEDITPLKEQARQLERQRDELEAELDDVFTRIDDAFYALDDEWRFTYLNEQAERLLGVTDADAHGRVVWEVFPELRDSEAYDAFHEALETEAPVTHEQHFGELETWFEVHAYPSETGLSVYFHDVTDQKRREQDLGRYEAVVETVNDGIYVKDEENVFTMVNETFAEMVGYERDELVGRDSSLVVSDEVVEAADQLYRDLATGDRETETAEAPLEAASGETVETEASFALIPRADGSDAERVGVVRDIAERKERERQLEQQNQRLESFASMLAHEIRNPLSIAQIYLRNARSGEEAAFDEVGDALERMEEIIDILLILARGSESAFDPEPVALSETATEVWSNLAADPGRLSVDTDIVLESEPHHLQHVVENLFQNALEHADDVTVRVGSLDAVREESERTTGGFYVEDDGPGIPDAARERIFEAGYTTDSTGLGLGLTFIDQIVDAYEWELALTESESGGARFEFTNVDIVPAE